MINTRAKIRLPCVAFAAATVLQAVYRSLSARYFAKQKRLWRVEARAVAAARSRSWPPRCRLVDATLNTRVDWYCRVADWLTRRSIRERIGIAA